MKFEDLVVGFEIRSPLRAVSRHEITAFAELYDRQPIHLGGANSPDALFDDIIGSGFMTLALTWQLWLDCGIQGTDGLGGLGLEDCRWHRALRPDTSVQGHFTIAGKRVSSTGLGIVTYAMRLNEIDRSTDSELCLVEFTTIGIMARRDANRPS